MDVTSRSRLVATLNESRKDPLYIYGPSGLDKYLSHNLNGPYCKICEYNIIVQEINDMYNILNTIKYNTTEYIIEYCYVTHTVPCYSYTITKKSKPKINYSKIESVITKYSDEITELGYSNPNKIINDLKERKTINLSNFTLKLEDYSIDSIDSDDLKLTIILDNCNSSNVIKFIKNSDILVHECTYIVTKNLSDKEVIDLNAKAISHGHTTHLHGLDLCKILGCKKLFFTHFSNRYEIKDNKMSEEYDIIEDARVSLPGCDVYCAYDFDEFIL